MTINEKTLAGAGLANQQGVSNNYLQDTPSSPSGQLTTRITARPCDTTLWVHLYRFIDETIDKDSYSGSSLVDAARLILDDIEARS
jgi:hypothetical protein